MNTTGFDLQPPDDYSESQHDQESQDDEIEIVQALCDDYIERHRDGEPVTINTFAGQHPEFEEAILEILPTMILMEAVAHQNRNKRKDGMVVRGPSNYEKLGDYEIVGELGRGGMGIVYEAYQASLDRQVAVKVLPTHLMDQEYKDRFFSEARIVARLHHSNIVPVFSVGEDQGVCFYAMEKLSGTPMDRYVESSGNVGLEEGDLPFRKEIKSPPLSIKDVVDIGIQVSDALAYAHRQGVTHRDVKPANLIRSQHGRVWLTDFGLATKVDEELDVGSSGISGTLRYVAPERIEGAVDAPTGDIYSLGVTLMELLSGKVAFSANRRGKLLEQIRTNEFNPINDDPAVAVDLVAILTKAAALDPTDRYQNAELLRDDLIRFSQGRSVAANPLGTLGKCWRWYLRNRALATVSLLAAVSLLSAAIISTVFYISSRQLLQTEQRLRSEATNASKVANQAVDEIFQGLNIGTGLAGIDSNDFEVAEAERTTHLLDQLTRFYERLAGGDTGDHYPFDPVSSRRKVGQIRMRLGEYEKAILDFESASTRLSWRMQLNDLMTDPDAVILQSQIINEQGLARRILGEREKAKTDHLSSLKILEEWKLESIDEQTTQAIIQRIDFEIARTLYFLANQTRPGMGPNSFPPERRMGPPGRRPLLPRPDEEQNGKLLDRAIASLISTLPESIELNKFDDIENLPEVDFQVSGRLADELHLLALCYREAAHDNRTLGNPEMESTTIDRLSC